MTAVHVRRLRKVYHGPAPVTALNGVDLEIESGEFFTLLGPSGCGKTTLLRLIAGFEQADEGQVEIDGQDIVRLAPDRRPVNTVFQHYALFPHLTVRENIAFGPLRKGTDRASALGRADEMLELVRLSQFGDRRPNQLSGGQQQRVALARALAPAPKILLLDEPLSALDLKLRQAMRSELRRLRTETGITFIFVTHDQEEALAMSDRIAVMSTGEIRQVGSPEEIYSRPANRFVADFIGEANIVEGVWEEGGLRHKDGLRVPVISKPDRTPGTEGCVIFRPEMVRLSNDPGTFRGKVTEITYLGSAR